MTLATPDRRRLTLSAVAAVAGTSMPTVSKVLRGGTDVSPEMRLKVMDAVRTVGYTRRGTVTLCYQVVYRDDTVLITRVQHLGADAEP